MSQRDLLKLYLKERLDFLKQHQFAAVDPHMRYELTVRIEELQTLEQVIEIDRASWAAKHSCNPGERFFD